MTEEQIEQYGQEIIRFGNWIVTENGILSSREIPRHLFIDKSILNMPNHDNANRVMYDTLLQMSRKTWFNELDVYQLNAAFFYAVEYFDVEPCSIVATLTRQLFEFEQRGDIDDSEIQELSM